MNIGILGSGEVARALANGFITHGHAVMLGTRESARLADFAAVTPAVRLGSFAEAARFAELAVIAVKGSVAIDAVRLAGAASLAGKPVIDATNPIADTPPVDGVISYYTAANDSQLETLQREFPAIRFVKAFNSIGNAVMIDPAVVGGPPTMFICGDDAAAKAQVSDFVTEFGWDVADVGRANAARAVEALCMLWVARGINSGEWGHAFKLLKPPT